MCMIGTPEAEDYKKHLKANYMMEDMSTSLAEECAKLCLEEKEEMV